MRNAIVGKHWDATLRRSGAAPDNLGGQHMSNVYNFDQHRAKAYRDYGAVREKYVRYATALEAILSMALKDLPTHNVSARAKSLDRFAAKASKPDPKDPTMPKYTEPMQQIEDMAAVRVITYVLRSLQPVEEVVHREFRVVDRSDKSDHLLETAQVGYRSIHLIVEMKPERAGLLEYRDFAGLKAEVQIRTILQHAWAEIEHDMRYKPHAEPNRILSQRFTALAGLIEVGDREFEQIYEIEERRRRELVDLGQIVDVSSALVQADAGHQAFLQGVSDLAISSPPPLRAEPTPSPSEPQPKELISAGQYTEAVARYNVLIQREPRQFGNFLGRAKARFLLGDAAGALGDIASAEALSPGNKLITRVRDLIEGRSDEDPRPAADQNVALRQGHIALKDGNPHLALEKYGEAEALGFNPVFSVFNRAMASFLARDYAVAQRTLDQIEPYSRSVLRINVIVLRTLCYLMADGDNPQLAIQWVEKALREGREMLSYQYNTRSPLRDLEMGVENHFSPDERLKVAPVFALMHALDSSELQAAGRPPASAPQGFTLSKSAEAANDAGQLEEARRLYQESLLHFERDNQAQGIMVAASNLGRLVKTAGDLEGAIVLFTKAAEAARSLGKHRDEAWNLGNLGSSYRDSGQLDKALESYLEALRLADNAGDARSAAITLDNIGVVMARTGDLQAAIESFRRAIQVDPAPTSSPASAGHRVNLGIALWRAGNDTEARYEWQQAYSTLSESETTPSHWPAPTASDLEKEMATTPSSNLPFCGGRPKRT